MLQNKLEQIGLTEKEAKIYLAMLELGETNIERISKKSKVKRSTVYDIIDSLKERGLAGSTIKNQKKHYFAVDPRELENTIDEKKNILKDIMPQLLSITNLIDKKPKISFYEGEEGLKEVYMDTLKYPNQPLWAWVTDDIFDILGEDFAKYYIPKRVKNKIWAYVIAPDTKELREYKSKDVESLRQTRIVKSSTFLTEVEIDLYGDHKICILSFKEKIGLIIQSEKIFKTLKSIFDFQWNELE
jgi:sugar-specific transcriptional regulator TrmB